VQCAKISFPLLVSDSDSNFSLTFSSCPLGFSSHKGEARINEKECYFFQILISCQKGVQEKIAVITEQALYMAGNT